MSDFLVNLARRAAGMVAVPAPPERPAAADPVDARQSVLEEVEEFRPAPRPDAARPEGPREEAPRHEREPGPRDMERPVRGRAIEERERAAQPPREVVREKPAEPRGETHSKRVERQDEPEAPVREVVERVREVTREVVEQTVVREASKPEPVHFQKKEEATKPAIVAREVRVVETRPSEREQGERPEQEEPVPQLRPPLKAEAEPQSATVRAATPEPPRELMPARKSVVAKEDPAPQPKVTPRAERTEELEPAGKGPRRKGQEDGIEVREAKEPAAVTVRPAAPPPPRFERPLDAGRDKSGKEPVEIRIGTIEIKAPQAPQAKAAEPEQSQPAAPEDFESYRGMRTYAGWYRG